jgi:hypothetical protein
MKPHIVTISIPSDATNIVVRNDEGESVVTFNSKIQDPLDLGGDMVIILSNLEPHEYSILGRFSELTEEILLPYVEGNNGGKDDTMWFDYRFDDHAFAPFQCTTPKKSILSYHFKSNGYKKCPFTDDLLVNSDFFQDFLVLSY